MIVANELAFFFTCRAPRKSLIFSMFTPLILWHLARGNGSEVYLRNSRGA